MAIIQRADLKSFSDIPEFALWQAGDNEQARRLPARIHRTLSDRASAGDRKGYASGFRDAVGFMHIMHRGGLYKADTAVQQLGWYVIDSSGFGIDAKVDSEAASDILTLSLYFVDACAQDRIPCAGEKFELEGDRKLPNVVRALDNLSYEFNGQRYSTPHIKVLEMPSGAPQAILFKPENAPISIYLGDPEHDFEDVVYAVAQFQKLEAAP